MSPSDQCSLPVDLAWGESVIGIGIQTGSSILAAARKEPRMASHFRIAFVAVTLVGNLAFTGCQSSKTTAAASNGPSVSATSPSKPTTQGDASVISVVKDGALEEYNTTTVGKAFEGTFQTPQWKSFETPKGETIVQFDGTIKAMKLTESGFDSFDSIYRTLAPQFMDGCFAKLGFAAEKDKFHMPWLLLVHSANRLVITDENDARHWEVQKCVYSQMDVPVQFQFTVLLDGKSFKAGYIEPTPFKINGECDHKRVFDFIYQ